MPIVAAEMEGTVVDDGSEDIANVRCTDPQNSAAELTYPRNSAAARLSSGTRGMEATSASFTALWPDALVIGVK